jgi:hypothetical protein
LLIEHSRDHSVLSEMNYNKDKHLKNAQLYNSSMSLWEDKRNSITDGFKSSIKIYYTRDAKLLLLYSNIANKMYKNLCHLF